MTSRPGTRRYIFFLCRRYGLNLEQLRDRRDLLTNSVRQEVARMLRERGPRHRVRPCPRCGTAVVRRRNFSCPKCSAKLFLSKHEVRGRAGFLWLDGSWRTVNDTRKTN
jgi:ribosomal protein S27AE